MLKASPYRLYVTVVSARELHENNYYIYSEQLHKGHGYNIDHRSLPGAGAKGAFHKKNAA